MNGKSDNLPLTEKEIKELLKGLEKLQGFKALLYLMLSTGMSLEDCMSINLKDIDYPNAQIVINSRRIKVNPTALAAIADYQDGNYKPQDKLFDVHPTTIMRRLLVHSEYKLGRQVTWVSIRRTWAVLAFKHGESFRSMIESSGANPDQLARWYDYSWGKNQNNEPVDLIIEFVE